MLLGTLIGYLIGLAIISLIGAAVISLSAKLFYNQKGIFGTAFFVSFVSFLAALFVDSFVNANQSANSFTASLPGIVFFVLCWLLNSQFIKYEPNGAKSYGKTFLITIVQCVALFMFIILLTFGFMAIFSRR